MREYKLIVCGGTFEYLHTGHQAFLQFALEKSEKILIGLTTDHYTVSMKKGILFSYAQRKKTLEDYFVQERVQNRVEIAPIDTVHIPDVWKQRPIEAIIATEDSLKGAEEINAYRKKQGLHALVIEVFPLVFSQGGKLISSSRIRGTQKLSKIHRLPDDLRIELKKPLGDLIEDFDSWVSKNKASLDPKRLITVGDVITSDANRLGLHQQFSVIDFCVERQKKFSSITEVGFLGDEEVIVVKNGAGTLTQTLLRIVEHLCKRELFDRLVLRIDGEEDLTVLPFLMFAPLGYTVLYGQPHLGVVKVVVSRTSKEHAKAIVNRFHVL